jgi:circadian clock protein KaiC
LSESDTPNVALRRLATGISGLDRVLGGGLVEAGVYLIEGASGTGKTILSSQIAFDLAGRGCKVVFVTLIAEAHGKLLQHLATLDFFDERLVPSRVMFLSGYQALLDHGLHGLLEFVATTVHHEQPSLLVIDGFSTVNDFAPEAGSLGRFVHNLNALVAAARCTTLLLAQDRGHSNASPEHALVDGFLELSVFRRDVRRARELEVHKMRGSAPVAGTHVFTITGKGVQLFPRLESMVTRERPVPDEPCERLAFGLAELDRMIGGGLWLGSTTSVLGAPGAGKTLFGMQFLAAGIARGEPCLYFGFFESPDRLLAKAAAVGNDLHAACDAGLLRVVWQPPVELFLDELAARLLAEVRSRKVTRLFIDGMEGFTESILHRERISTFLTALTVELRGLDVTTLVSEELPLFSESINHTRSTLSAVAENILLLRYVEITSEVQRLFSIMKLRESSFDSSIRPFAISSRGIEMLEKLEGVERTLTGYAERAQARAGAAANVRPRDPKDRQ